MAALLFGEVVLMVERDRGESEDGAGRICTCAVGTE